MIKLSEQNIIDMMIEIKPLDREKFLLVRETLTRMGVPGRDDKGKKVLNQSVHILHKRGHYYLTHFKHLFLLDGRFERTEITDDDIDRMFLVAKLLKEWGLIEPLNDDKDIEDPDLNFGTVRLTVIPAKSKEDWILVAKHSIGSPRRGNEDGKN